MKFLVFDLETTGHHPGYLEHLIDGWAKPSVSGELHLVVAHDFQDLFPHIIEKVDGYSTESRTIHIHFAPKDPTSRYRSTRNKYLQGWLGFGILSPFVHRLTPDRIFFPKIDYYLLPLAFLAQGKRYRKRVSGILFMFGAHYKKLFNTDIPLLFKIRDNIYRVSLLLIGIRKMVRTLMSLDETALPSLKKLCPSAEMVPCPDPVNINAAKNATPVPLEELGIEPGRVVFLTIGYLCIEKGVFDILKCVLQLDKQSQKQVCLLFIGPIVEEDQAEVHEWVRLVHEKTEVQVVFHEKVVQEEKMQDYIAVAQYIFILYRQHIGRSAILVRAAAAEIPVISSKWGLVGWQVEDLDMGHTVVVSRKDELANLMSSLVKNQWKLNVSQKIAAFAENNSKEAFAREVLRYGAGQDRKQTHD